jgi:YD repeat-containing protein
MNKKLRLFAFLWMFVVGAICEPSLLAQTSTNLRYIYDAKGQLIGVIDENNNARAYNYDAAGNMISIEHLAPQGAVDIFFVEPNRGRVGTAPGSGTPVTIHGIGFSAVAADNQVTFNGVSAVVETATATAIKTKVPAGATTGRVRVTSPLGAAVSRSDFTVLSLSVMVSPASVSVRTGERQQFTATLSEGGTAISGDVIWSLSPAVGTIDRNGLYTGPARSPLARTVTVTATSAEAPTSRGSARINIIPSGTGPVYAHGASYRIARPAPMPLAAVYTPGASYRIARPAQIARAPIFNPGASYTSVAITGLSPGRAARGVVNLSFTATGRNFNGATALDFLLPSGVRDTNIAVANLAVSADGTQITAILSVASGAAAGARTAVVRTPAGPSTARVTESNQFVIE